MLVARGTDACHDAVAYKLPFCLTTMASSCSLEIFQTWPPARCHCYVITLGLATSLYSAAAITAFCSVDQFIKSHRNRSVYDLATTDYDLSLSMSAHIGQSLIWQCYCCHYQNCSNVSLPVSSFIFWHLLTFYMDV